MTETNNIIHVGGIQINFPYPSAYTAQNQLMAKVINALSKKQNAILESPTGSGKSLAILCSVLAWHKTKYPFQPPSLPNKPSTENELKTNNFKPKAPKIIFTSRTHTQLQQLISEYRRTNYFQYFQMNILGSRKSLCINKKIQPLSDRNDQCKKAVENRDCKYYRSYAYGQQFKTNLKFTHGKVFDIEDLVIEGNKISCCPYMGTRAILDNANLIFCPYNYILDPMIRDQMNIDIKNSIIIIDEAHNVEDVCRGALTKSYTLEELQFSIDELKKLMGINGMKYKNNDVWESMSEIKELLNLIMLWMKDLNDTLTMSDYNQHRNVFPHPDKGINKIRDIMKDKWEYDKKKSLEYINHAQVVFKHFSESKQQNEIVGPIETTTIDSGGIRLNPIVGVIIEYFCIYLLPNALEYENDFDMALLPVLTYDKQLRKKIKKIHLHFWCLSPSVAFIPITKLVHSIILTSGTLSPLDAMAFELKCKFEHRLVADHVIEPGQVLVTAIDRGINGNQIKCVWKNLQLENVQDDIGVSLLSLFTAIPEGIVVFFPSYNTMQTLIDRWINSGIYEKMINIKKLYQEPRGSDENATKQFMDAIETFGRDCGNIKYINKYKRSEKYKKECIKKNKIIIKPEKKGAITKYLTNTNNLKKDYSFKPNEMNNITSDFEDTDLNNSNINTFKSEKGAVFFGVCRGKISEGIDFSDGMSRAVILIGIPYPNQKDSQIHFKKKFNDQQAQKIKAKYFGKPKQLQPFIVDGKYWYSLQAFRALNQALGRCIRHKHDYGAIIFLETRFYGNSNYTKNNINNLSKWVRPYMRNSINVQQAIKNLIKPYFEYMNKNPPRGEINGMIKWKPPFEMPKNIWHNQQKKNRFYTQSPANNYKGLKNNKNMNHKNININNKNINHKGFMAASQSPANNYKGLKNNNNNSNNLVQLNKFSFSKTPPNHVNNSFKPHNNITNSKTPPNHINNSFKPHNNITNSNGNNNGFSFNTRKRKYDEIQNENECPINKRLKLESPIKQEEVINNNKEPNCIQCKGCSAMICCGKFKEIEFNKGNGKMQGFIASNQPFPCDTSKDCIWSSALGLTFMYKYCSGCSKSVGFHIVGAMEKDKLQYVGQILFISGGVNLLTTR